MSGRRNSLALNLLPLTLLAAMLAIGVGIEAVVFGGVDGVTKLPLGLLLMLTFLRRRGETK